MKRRDFFKGGLAILTYGLVGTSMEAPFIVTSQGQAASQDILPKKITSGQWTRLKSPYTPHAMPDGHVLGWVPTTGEYRLWRYSASQPDLLTNPGGQEVSGQWTRLVSPYTLHVMPDGHVLGWVSTTGEYRLWGYSAFQPGLLTNPGGQVVSGQWTRLVSPYTLHVMPDGHVLGWVPTTGEYRLWRYNPTQSGLLTNPGGQVVSGQWTRLISPYTLHVMPDGHVLGWVPATGEYRLWQYSASQPDLLTNPGGQVVSGQWTRLKLPYKLHVMSDGNVLGWNPETGEFHLWAYAVP